MQIVSDGFRAAMEWQPYGAKLIVGGEDIIPSEAVQEIYFRGGANPSGDQVILGGAVSASVEITLHKAFVSCELENRELTVSLGQKMNDGIEWLPMGTYTIENTNVDDDLIILTAQDALHAKFEVDYEPLEGFDFTAEGGVDSILFLQALCARRGVAVDVEGLTSHPLKISPEGFTERQIIGFIGAIYGGFANISRTGVLRIVRYAATETKITADNYYENGMEKSNGDFLVGWLKCYNEVSELTMFVGDFDATQGIYLESIWMNQTILNEIWEAIGGAVFRPVKNLTFMGDPTIDPGDIIQLEDLSGQLVSVPVMSISHEYDGGMMTSVTASGQAKTTEKESPSSKSVNRKIARETGKLTQEELLRRLTKDWADDGLYLTEDGKLAIKATAILAGILKGIEIIGESGSIGGFEMSDHTLTAKFRRDFDFTQEDVDKARAYYMGEIELTAEEIARLDVTMNGRIQAGDAMVMTSMINGNLPNYTEGRIVIDATNPRECIIIEVTDGYRAGQRTVLAMGFASVSRMESDLFSCGGSDGYTGEISAGDVTLNIKGGIIVGVS